MEELVGNRLSSTEQLLLRKSVEGGYASFCALDLQVDSLRVINRRRGYWNYQVDFEIIDQDLLILDEVEANMTIRGTRVTILESDSCLNVSVMVLNGYIRWMNLSGDFEFSDCFTVNNVYWENRNYADPEKSEFVFESKKRSYQSAISYLPTYK